jgi:hypothetical protein
MRYFGLAVIATLYLWTPLSVSATQPVPKTVVGCVQTGRLSADGYVFRVTKNDGTEYRDVDLTAYEGKTLRVEGQLLPGDVLAAATIEVVAEDCSPEARAGAGR